MVYFILPWLLQWHRGIYKFAVVQSKYRQVFNIRRTFVGY